MTLIDDTARCNGKHQPVPFGTELHPTCIDCLRRTSPGDPNGQWYQGTPEFTGECPSKIINTEGN